MKGRIKSVRKAFRGFWNGTVTEYVLATVLLVVVLVNIYLTGVIDIRPSNYNHLIIAVVLIGMILAGLMLSNIYLMHKVRELESENGLLKSDSETRG